MSEEVWCRLSDEVLRYFSFLFTFSGICDIIYAGRINMEQTAVKNILYDPRSDTYKVRFGKFGEETMEISGSSLHSENAGAILRGTDDDFFRKTYIGDWLAKDEKTEDPVSIYTRGTVGVSVFKPEHPAIIVYSDKKTAKDQPDRYPSIPYRAIIEDAIELLRKNKKLRLSKISLNRFESRYILAISSRSFDYPEPPLIRTLEISIMYTAFDRALETELDREAGLKASLDTDTYIKLRIAFLLYKALSMNDKEAKKFWMVGIFSVLGSSTQHDFSF